LKRIILLNQLKKTLVEENKDELGMTN